MATMMVRKITKNMTMSQIQSILKQGGFIQFETAVYNITKTLELYPNSVIDLNGATLRQGAAINHILLTHSDENTIKYNGAYNIEITNGILEGMGKYNTKLNLITLCHARDILIHNVTFEDVVEFHSIEINSSYCVTIRNCNFYGHNTGIDKDDFREQIQIDSAVESALVVVPLGSKWYDGTACDTIVISNCGFSSSSSRPAASQCIGNHCQFSGPKHKRISICRNIFAGGNQVTPGAPCIRLVGMEDVVIADNICRGYGRFVQICTYTYTYGLRGKEKELKETDGVCTNVRITGNEVRKPSGNNAAPGIYITTKTGNHKKIFIEDNTFDFGTLKGKYAVYIKNINQFDILNNAISTNTKIYKSQVS